MTDPETGNLLLSAMRQDLYNHAVAVELHTGELLSVAGSSPTHVYFPAGCLVSWVGRSREGQRVELAVVGREGMAGTSTLFSEMPTAWDLEVQVGGLAYRVPCATLKRAFCSSTKARKLVLAFVACLLAQTGQSCICLASHSAETRLARWLLTAQERLQLAHLPFSQESLSTMIGVRRPTISLVAGKLEKAGLLELGRTRIRIVDHEALARIACECYQLTNSYLEQYTKLLNTR